MLQTGDIPEDDAPIQRVCCECGRPFEISSSELAFFRDLAARYPDGHSGTGWRLPWACRPCRSARRRMFTAAVDDGIGEELYCVDCGGRFYFGSRDKAYYAKAGFARPRRCGLCRSAARQMRAAAQGSST